jgi:cytochrome c oxidase subunit II
LSAVLTVALVGAAAAAANNGLSPVEPESPNAHAIRTTYWVILAVTAVIFVLVEATLIVFIVRFRARRRERDQEAPQIHGATRLETSFTVVPVLILFGIMAFVFVKLPTIKDAPAARAAGELKIRVVAHQYYWEFQYPGGKTAIQHMVVPVDRVVTLDIVSPDVAHSWWVPALGGKIDAIPGRLNKTWFEAKRSGVFLGQCAELCGIYHARMTNSVEVMPAAEFDAWLEERSAQQSAGTSPLGEELWEGSCAKCHGLEGEGGYGPRIAGTDLVTDEAAIAKLVREGGPVKMPPVGRDWNQAELDALAAYLKENLGG